MAETNPLTLEQVRPDLERFTTWLDIAFHGQRAEPLALYGYHLTPPGYHCQGQDCGYRHYCQGNLMRPDEVGVLHGASDLKVGEEATADGLLLRLASHNRTCNNLFIAELVRNSRRITRVGGEDEFQLQVLATSKRLFIGRESSKLGIFVTDHEFEVTSLHTQQPHHVEKSTTTNSIEQHPSELQPVRAILQAMSMEMGRVAATAPVYS